MALAIIVGWFVLNLFLYVVMIGKSIEFTVSSAVLALFIYPVLIWLAFQL